MFPPGETVLLEKWLLQGSAPGYLALSAKNWRKQVAERDLGFDGEMIKLRTRLLLRKNWLPNRPAIAKQANKAVNGQAPQAHCAAAHADGGKELPVRDDDQRGHDRDSLAIENHSDGTGPEAAE